MQGSLCRDYTKVRAKEFAGALARNCGIFPEEISQGIFNRFSGGFESFWNSISLAGSRAELLGKFTLFGALRISRN